MKYFKKRTLALILASTITVVGAFGANNYSNSIMSLKINDNGDDTINMTVYTKKKFVSPVNIVRKDSHTYNIILADTNSEVSPNDQQYDSSIDSVEITTMPYTNTMRGYTKLIVKTKDDIPLKVNTSMYLETTRSEARSIADNTTKTLYQANDTIHSRSGVDQTGTVDINSSVKQFQNDNNYVNSSNGKSIMDILYLILGGLLVGCISIFLFLKAKEKMKSITGESLDINVDYEPKKKIEKKISKNSINRTISHLDQQYSQPYTIPQSASASVPAVEEPAKSEESDFENMVVDLDELLQEKQAENKSAEAENTKVNATEDHDNSDDEDNNWALEDFLDMYNDSDDADEDNSNVETIPKEENEEKINEQLYEKCINQKDIQFSKSDVNKIDLLLNSEIADDTMKFASENLVSTEKNKKPTSREILEDMVMTYSLKQNVVFSKDDVKALYKLISVEIDNSFITDLRTNPARMQEMQEELKKQKAKPHKVSEILTLNVKDVLPDLSKALKKQGRKRIESEVKPQVVYYSEGYDVQTLKISDSLPDLATALDSDQDDSKYVPAEIQYTDDSYDVQTLSIGSELPDLSDVMKNPKKYEDKEPEPVEVDEQALLNNVLNVSFKPFDDGSRDFEVINDFPENEEVNNVDNSITVSDMQDEFNQFGENFEIVQEDNIIADTNMPNDNDDFQTLYDGKYVDLDNTAKSNEVNLNQLQNQNNSVQQIFYNNENPISNAPRNIEQKDIKDVLLDDHSRTENKQQLKKEKHNSQGNKTSLSSANVKNAEFCILNNEKFTILSTINLSERKGCYLAKNDNGYSILGYIGDRVLEIKHYESLLNERLQARLNEKLSNGVEQYLVRVGRHKFIMNVKEDSMELVMDLC